MRDQLPNDEVMRAMAKLAFENATEYLAKMAEEFAAVVGEAVSGADALRAFAAAIRSTNATTFPPDGLNS